MGYRHLNHKRAFLAFLLLLISVNDAKHKLQETSFNPTVWTGRIILDTSAFTQTFGWALLISSDIPLSSVTVTYDGGKRVQSFLPAKNFYVFDAPAQIADLSTLPKPIELLVTLEGNFGSAQPNISVQWDCVTVDVNLGCETVDDSSSSQEITEEPTTTLSVSTQNTMMTTELTTTPTAAKFRSNVNGAPKTFMGLDKKKTSCYVGSSLTTITPVKHLLICGGLCMDNVTCTGINFWQARGQCDLVQDNTTGLLSHVRQDVDDCQFYEVLWKPE